MPPVYGVRRAGSLLLALAILLAPGWAMAHPHLWIQQVVRAIAKDGKYTHVEIEWKFDPYSSEVEIPLIDEDKSGKFSPAEIKTLEKEMMPELKNVGFLTWLNVGGKDRSEEHTSELQSH